MTQSPFPGMDPWLERYWGDVHHRLINYSCDSIEESLPPGLVARMEERVYLEFDERERQRRIADVVVVEQSLRDSLPVAGSSGIAVAEPLRLRVESEPVTEGFIQIMDGDGRVLTVIEVLSPGNNRPGAGQRMYIAKQRELCDSGVSLVEIDLLRGGERVLNARPEMIPEDYRTEYQACVRRGDRPDIIEVYRIPMHERLPAIRIPLRPADPDLPLDLQAVLDQTYRKGRYGQMMDYRAALDPPLSAENEAWANTLLNAQNLR
jgi:hypothetical protein